MSSFKAGKIAGSPKTSTREIVVYLEGATAGLTAQQYEMGAMVALPQDVNTLLKMELMEYSYSAQSPETTNHVPPYFMLSLTAKNVVMQPFNVSALSTTPNGDVLISPLVSTFAEGKMLLLTGAGPTTDNQEHVIYSTPRVMINTPCSNFNYFSLKIQPHVQGTGTEQIKYFMFRFNITYYDQSQASLYQGLPQWN